MAYCPFCKRDVPEKLVLHGGTCPHCFGDIPGEETPTDPGEQVKEQIRLETEASALRRQRAPLYALLPLAAATLGAAWFFLAPVQVQELELGDLAIELDFESFDGQQGDHAVKVKSTSGKRDGAAKGAEKLDAPGRSTPDARNGQLDGTDPKAGPGVVAADYQPEKGRQPSVAGTPPAGGLEPPALGDGLASGEGSGFSDLSPTASRGVALLTDDADIKRALQDTIRARKGRLLQCYEQSLKADEELSGQWKVSMVIRRDGSFGDVVIKAIGRQSDTFESCVRDQVASWSIKGKLEADRSMTFPLKFGQ